MISRKLGHIVVRFWCTIQGNREEIQPRGICLRRYAIILVGLLGLWTGAIRAQEDVLVGVTWSRSELLSFDPRSGITKEKHLQLNPYEDFRGLAFDARRRRLYALAQGT